MQSTHRESRSPPKSATHVRTHAPLVQSVHLDTLALSTHECASKKYPSFWYGLG
jgi:hypothetical protein